VASADHYYAVTYWCINRVYIWIGNRTIHIHNILTGGNLMSPMTIPGRDRLLEAVLAAALFFLLLYLLVGSRSLLAVSIILMAGALVSSRVAGVIGKVWLKGAHTLGSINSCILLTTLFFCVLTPLAVISRFFRPNLLQILKDTSTTSYFIERPRQFALKDFEKPW